MAKAKTTRLRLPPGFRRRTFRENANPIGIHAGAARIGTANPKEHSSGSLGWRMDTKFQMRVGKDLVWVQASTVFTVIGSKDLPRDDQPEATP